MGFKTSEALNGSAISTSSISFGPLTTLTSMGFMYLQGRVRAKWVFENLNSLSLRPLGGIALSFFHFTFRSELQNLLSFPSLYYFFVHLSCNQSATL